MCYGLKNYTGTGTGQADGLQQRTDAPLDQSAAGLCSRARA